MEIEQQVQALTGKSKYLVTANIDNVIDGKYISPSSDNYFSSLESLINTLRVEIFNLNKKTLATISDYSKISTLLSTLTKTIGTSYGLINKHEIEAQLNALTPENLNLAASKFVRIQNIAAEKREHLQQLAAVIAVTQDLNSGFAETLTDLAEKESQHNSQKVKSILLDRDFHKNQFSKIVEALHQDISSMDEIFQKIQQRALLAHASAHRGSSEEVASAVEDLRGL